MKFLFDFLPVALFFAAFKFAGIYVATGVAIATTTVQVLWLKLRGQRVHGMLWASLAIIVVFGGATLLLQDDTFIKWKPTVLYWLFSIVLAVSPALFHKNLIRMMLSEQMKLPDGIWGRLNWSWVVFFALMGVLNLYVAFSFSESYCADIVDGMARSACANNIWVNFKLFGGIGLMIAFVVGQTLLLARYVEEEDKA